MLHPENVYWRIDYTSRGMVASLACPLAEDAALQSCATTIGHASMLVFEPRLDFDALPTPAVGSVLIVSEPVSCNTDYTIPRCCEVP